jgi:SAM-dependent methyltransferase
MRYPVDGPSMRAFLETFFTRHLFQLQRSLAEYITSIDFQKAIQFGPLRILDIGAGPAVASLGITDLIHRMAGDGVLRAYTYPRAVRMVHVLNDNSPICLATGRRMLAACQELGRRSDPRPFHDRVFALPTAFPSNMRQIQQVASFIGGYDIVILSYVVNPLTDDCGLENLAVAVRTVERFCKPRGRILVVQDKFQESLVRSLAHLLNTECHEQTVTQEVYPPRGSNDTYTYTYYDCLYAPRERSTQRAWCAA